MTGGRVFRTLVALVAAAALAAGCATTIAGHGEVAALDIPVHGDSGGPFDTEAKAALSDVIDYWKLTYPTIARGAALPPLRGGLYSVDGVEVARTHSIPADVRGNKCLQRRIAFIIDNAAYCQLDDSIVWDRGRDHLLPALAARYGPALTALVFAHEYGHAIQHRLHIAGNGVRTIDVESQADCAAGAFAAAALAGTVPHTHITPADLDRALAGYFQIRDSTPDTPAQVTHGNGFDRINALQQGIQHGASFCFSPSYLRDRTYTERGYQPGSLDYAVQGNQPLAEVLGPDGIGPDLNRFWRTAGGSIGESFKNVRLAQADHPRCGAADPSSRFAYCPADNTVYYSGPFAQRAYYSITDVVVNKNDATVSLVPNEPGDYALGVLFAVAWGMAARTQFFGRPTTGRQALLAAVCYAGAYSADINRENGDPTHPYVLSPPDMDEATAAVLDLVDLDTAFGARHTSGLERVQSFVKGYTGGLPAC